MATRFRCPCGQKLKTPDQTVGKRGRCPQCGGWFRIPESRSFDVTAEAVSPRSGTPPLSVSAESRAVEPRAKSPPPAPAAEKGRLVVADSHDGCRKDLSNMLREHGYVVLEAHDGPTAIELIRTAQPDAAILDVKLDIYTGFHVIEAIHDPIRTTNKAVWDMPILMTAAAMRGRDEQYAIHLGAQGYFLKPVMAAELCPRLEKAIHAYRGT